MPSGRLSMGAVGLDADFEAPHVQRLDQAVSTCSQRFRRPVNTT